MSQWAACARTRVVDRVGDVLLSARYDLVGLLRLGQLNEIDGHIHKGVSLDVDRFACNVLVQLKRDQT